MSIDNCIDCANHQIESDPDPDDWFCDDDVKVRCNIAKCKTPKHTDRGNIMTSEPYITVACRPYNIRKECEIPNWCPKKYV